MSDFAESAPVARSIQSAVPGRRPTRGRKAAIAFLCVIGLILLLLWYIGVFGGNVHTVVAGQLYRSAQLSGNTLGRVLDADHIKTVINLRGGSPDDGFYRSEMEECSKRGIAHVDVPFSARFLPPPNRLAALLSTFDHASYPVLIHCRGGSDRTGLTSTLYLAIYRGVPLDQAEASQLTFRYGHISWGEAHPMNDFFDLYRKTGAGKSLRDWILHDYPALFDKSPEALRGDAPDLKTTGAALAH